ncbi:MAG: hypothetical protein ACK4X1_14600 [Terricaulis sp.]
MAKLSRRKLIAGAAAAPLAGSLNGKTTRQASKRAKVDPVVKHVAAWMAERDHHDAMALEWSKLESKLERKTRGKMELGRATRSSAPEARAMRLLDRRIAASWKRLERAAARIVMMRPTSAQGALAKIRLAVRIQGPYDWHDDYVYALVQDGCEQLVLMLASEA